jgi:putative peptide zinc metalloprotease protein
VFYSFVTWIYRFFLFLGIALLVYFFAFKLLGIFLFIVEIIWFIARPVYAEIKRWWARRALFSWTRQTRRTTAVFFTVILLAFMPWRTSITAPAIIESTFKTSIHLPDPAQVAKLHVTNGQTVQKGDALLSTLNPTLDHEIALAERKARLLSLQVTRYAASLKNLRDKLVIEQRLAEAQSRLSGLRKRRAAIQLHAPSSGVVQFTRHLAPDHWLEPEQGLFFIYEPRQSQVVSFVAETQMHRIQKGAEVKFIADDGVHGKFAARLIAIEDTAIEQLAYPELTSTHGGAIAVHAEGNGTRTVDAYYKLRAELLHPPKQIRANIVGRLHIETAPYAPMGALGRAISALLLRESGF